MISFLNDYNEIASPEIMDALSKRMNEKYIGYSEDELANEAIEILRNKLDDKDLEIHFVHGGTIANVLGIIHSLQRFESVISSDTGHIVNTENASIEAVGHQIVLVQNVNGKIVIDELKKAIKSHSNEYNSKPKLVYLSNVTELGTVYKLDELKKLREYCDENNLYLFMDGARLGNAIMSKYSDIKFRDLPKLFDIFTIGGTKNGFLFGEAIVISNDKLKDIHFRRLIKQRGALLAKGFLYGIQFKTMFENDLYFTNAKNAVDMAQKLKDVFIKYEIKPIHEVEANLVFVEIPIELKKYLDYKFKFSYDTINEKKGISRFVTTWNTKLDEIKEIDRVLSNFYKK